MTDAIARRYRRFADAEAHGRSPLYEELAQGVAADEATRAFLATLPPAKQQPNLLFAAIRHLFGIPQDWPAFRHTLLANTDTVRDVMLTHATQTNEPARCAQLLPVLSGLPPPLAIIEVGASAGLCLLPDFYAYDYGSVRLYPPSHVHDPPLIRCSASPGTPLPDAIPHIVWRAGLDLNPLNPADPQQAAWLEALVWPEQTDRLARLRAALRIAGEQQTRIVQGDLLGEQLEGLCREAPADATLVIFHTAVLAYVADPAARQGFTGRVQSLCHTWIANEAPGIAVDARPAPHPGWFLLAVNGDPVAWTEPHGAAMAWIGRPDGSRRKGDRPRPLR